MLYSHQDRLCREEDSTWSTIGWLCNCYGERKREREGRSYLTESSSSHSCTSIPLVPMSVTAGRSSATFASEPAGCLAGWDKRIKSFTFTTRVKQHSHRGMWYNSPLLRYNVHDVHSTCPFSSTRVSGRRTLPFCVTESSSVWAYLPMNLIWHRRYNRQVVDKKCSCIADDAQHSQIPVSVEAFREQERVQ